MAAPGFPPSTAAPGFPPPTVTAPGFPAPQVAAAGFPAPTMSGPQPFPGPQNPQRFPGPQPNYGPQPGYGPAGYPPPYYGPPMMARKTNGMAVAGMVLGIVSLVLFWVWFLAPVLAVLGIIFSGVGISQCNQLRQDGKGMAVAGLVCSLISAAFWVLLVIAIESFLDSL
jgi:hypothetical protein